MNTEKTACIFFLLLTIILFSTFGYCAEEINQTPSSQQSAHEVSNHGAPATNDITVRSELERGGSAFILCDMQMMEISNPTRCVLDILQEEQLKHTVTDGFKLGLYFRGWLDMDNYKQILINSGNYLISVEVSEYIVLFNSYRTLLTQLALSDQELCEALGLKYDVVKLKIDNAIREFQ